MATRISKPPKNARKKRAVFKNSNGQIIAEGLIHNRRKKNPRKRFREDRLA